MKLLWLSDLHLDFLKPKVIAKFIASLHELAADGIVITGDIAKGVFLYQYLEGFTSLNIPIYFVLGNHDYYDSSISFVRGMLSDMDNKNLKYLHLEPKPIHLTNETVLVGVDGWCDGRLGDWEGSKVILNDFSEISDFSSLKKNARLKRMQELAEDSRHQLHNQLSHVGKLVETVIIATHVPPYKEACIHEGRVSADNWLPLFSSKVIGDEILQHANRNPCQSFLVLCGHTHSCGSCQIADNVHVITAQARYYHPSVQKEMEII